MEDADSNNGETPALYCSVCRIWHRLRLLE